jgi:hypothetical protein
MQMFRICEESGLLDPRNPGLLLLGSERQNHKTLIFEMGCVLQLSGALEHHNHGSTIGPPLALK